MVLITGASMGIGLEFANVFAKNGFDLYLVARSEDKLKNLAIELENKYRVKAEVQAIDLSVPGAAKTVYDQIKNKGFDIEILVNNAGFGDFGFFVETEWEKERQMIELNILAVTHFSKLFSKDMADRKSGKILNMGSIASFMPGPGMAVYFATKAFVLSFSEAISNELEGTGVTVFCLCPGPTQSNFYKAANLKSSKIFNSDLIPSSAEVAEFGFQALMTNKVVSIPGFWNKLMAVSVRFIPRFLVRKIVGYVQINLPAK